MAQEAAPFLLEVRVKRTLITPSVRASSQKAYVDCASILVLCVLILIFCQDLVVKGEVPFYRDLTNYFYPLRYSLYRSYRAGEIPLWDHHFAQGFPNLAAFQSGVFYFPHWLFAVLPFFTTIRTLFVLHFLVAAIGTYKLFRHWRYSAELAVVGAMLFTLGGTIVSMSNLLNHFQSAVWLPWLILFFERALLRPGLLTLVGLSLLAGCQFLAGSPEVFALSLGLALLDGLRIRSCERDVSFGRISLTLLGATVLMLGTTMAQFLPTAELFLESRRGQSIPAAEAIMWSLEPSAFLNLFFIDKEVELGVGVGVSLFFTHEVPLLISSYLGIPWLMGVVVWTYISSRRERLYFGGLVFGSLALALGSNTLIYPLLLQYVPLLGAVRFPQKFFFVTYALLLFMSMRGLQALVVEPRVSKIPIILVGSICAFWIALYSVCWLRPGVLTDIVVRSGNIRPSYDYYASATAALLINLERQVALSLALFLIFVLLKTKKIRPLVFSTLLVMLVYVDLGTAHRALLFPVHPDQVYRSSPVLKPAQTQLSRVFFYPAPHDLHPAYFTVNGQPTFEQAVALSFNNYLPNVGVFQGLEYFQEIDALGRRSYADFLHFANGLEFSRQIQLLRAFNVKYIVSFRQLPEEGISLVSRFPEHFSWLYRVEKALPRAFLVNRTVVAKDRRKRLEELSSRQFDPQKAVVLEHDLSITGESPLSAFAHIQRYTNNSVIIHATSNQDSLLVLTDSFYPGWKAYLDGNEVPILRANHFHRAVMVSQGEHVVHFRYEPESFRLGVIVSVLTIVSLAIIVLAWVIRTGELTNSASSEVCDINKANIYS